MEGRRSSIRNPNNLRTNINDNMNEAGRLSRRVSFSSKNRVKTFVKGSETTQWDLTYEEAINSTQSSQEITNKSLEKSTPKCGNSVDSFGQNQEEKEQSVDADHANQTLLNIESLSMEIEEIDRPTQIHTHKFMVDIDKENLPILINKEFDMEMTCQKEQTICQSINNMEITCQNTMKNPDISDMEFTCQIKNLPNNLTVKSMSDKTDMQITCQQIKNDEIEAEKENLHFSPSDMEFTCRLPSYTIASTLNKTKMELTCQQLEKIEKSEIELNKTDMEFTCKLENYSTNELLKSVQNKTEMELTCQQSKQIEKFDVEINKTGMEFTCGLPNSTADTSLKSIANKSVMEFTCQQQQEKIEKSEIELINKADMEFTCRLPNSFMYTSLKPVSNRTDMELTCLKSEKIEESEIGLDETEMEFTCRLPNSFINAPLKSVLNKTEMELTCQRSKKVDDSEIESVKTDMEFTCGLPNSTEEAPLKPIVSKSVMELTCRQSEKLEESEIEAHRTDIELTYRSRKTDEIELEKIDMDITSRLPNSTLNLSIPHKTQMELTCEQNTNNKTTNSTTNRRQTIFSVKNDVDNSNTQSDDFLSNSTKISSVIKELDSSPISNNTNQQVKNTHTDESEMKASELSLQTEIINQDSNVEKKQQPICQREEDGNLESEDMEFTCRLPIFSSTLKLQEMPITLNSIKQQTLNNLEVTKTNISKLKAREIVMEQQSAIDMELSCRLSNSVTLKTNVEEREVVALEENSDVLVVEGVVNLTEPKLMEVKNEVVEEQQIRLDNNVDVEEMEWRSITPRKSIRKSTIQEENIENRVEIDRTRKRSLLSSFIPFDSPQIIKKPTLSNENQIQKSSLNLSTKFTTPDNKKKSHIPTPISSGKSKKKKLTQPDEEHLDFLPIVTATTNSVHENKKILYSQKVDRNFKKLDLTYIKTPDRSGVKVMSPCIDDTQQLIDATVHLPEGSISINKTKSVNKLQETEITLPSTSGIQLNIGDNDNINDTAASLIENRLFQNINNTFVLNKLSNRKCKNEDEENVNIDDCSIELVTSPDNSENTINNYDIIDDYNFPLTRKFLEGFQIKQFSYELVPLPKVNFEKKQKIINDFVDNFEFKRFDIPLVEDIERRMENLRIEYEQKLENNSIIEISDSEHNEMALEEKIRALGKEREECIWKLVEAHNNLYKFNIVYSRLILSVELNSNNENVSNFTIEIAQERITNLLIYIYKAIKHKLNVSNVQSSLGQSYDLIAFLQYIEMVIEKFISFIKDFTIYSFYDTTFDEDCWLHFKIRDAGKMKFFIISVNMLNFENLTDEDIKVTLKFGDCDVKKLKKIVKKCSKLPRFLRNSIKTIKEYCV